nr:immunoglobulin light chain junction region [Macaca mulatta]MOV65804.1 immunoglobulin light chain junction region [Macaca mulatta]MOV65821.1 immunoglobulin light chain junction region [Macaca mulatta]MOV66798.1 immunoglobulin light chain junction region [Macaca mulatta]MOV67037.1 immunoglobulin light chain junction region [Macaca mulatta]
YYYCSSYAGSHTYIF